MASSKTPTTRSTSVDMADLVELLVHVPPRGKRAAFITMQTDIGHSERRIELSNEMIVQILSILLPG